MVKNIRLSLCCLIAATILVAVHAARPAPASAAAPPSTATLATGYSKISAGYRFTCGLKTTGMVYCWGYNQNGEIGQAEASYVSTTQIIPSIRNATDVAAGEHHACALLQSGQVQCWGSNGSGELGNNSDEASITPVTVQIQNGTPLTRVVQVSVGSGFSCARLATMDVTCWGSGGNGALGDGTTDDRWYAGPTIGLSSVSSISSTWGGYKRTCAVTTGGDAYCWGKDWASNSSFLVPTQKVGISNAVEVSTGFYHACVKLSNGEFRCWGTQWNLETGTNLVSGDIYTNTGTTVSSIIAGGSRTCLVTTDNKAKCWGNGWNGTLGTGSNSDRTTPGAVKISSGVELTNVVQLTSGESSGCALTTTGSVYCWGYQGYTARPWAAWGDSETSYAGPIADGAAPVLGNVSVSSDSQGVRTIAYTYSGSQYCNTFSAVKARIVLGTKADLSDGVTQNQGPISSCGGEAPHYGSYGLSTGSAGGLLSALRAGTTYYYRLTLSSVYGDATDEIRTFTTSGKLPVVVKLPSAISSESTATVSFTIDSDGLVTNYQCKVSTDQSMSTLVSTLIGTTQSSPTLPTTSAANANCNFTNLRANTQYYFSFTASNELGTADTITGTFTTSATIGVSVNNGDLFTRNPNVKLSITTPVTASKVLISNDGGFGKAKEIMSGTMAAVDWTLDSAGDERLPKTVYVRYVGTNGQSQTVTDDIILDTTAPVFTSATASSTTSTGGVTVAAVTVTVKNRGVRVFVRASDVNSGVNSVEIRLPNSARSTVINYPNPKAKTATFKISTKSRTLQVRVVDKAGNSTKWKTVTVR